MNIVIADIETNGFNPDTIWVLGILDLYTDDYVSYEGDDIPHGLMRLAEADLIIGHCFKSFDAVQIKKLTDGLINIPKEKIIDTHEYSRKLFEMEKHTLETWGELLGIPKLGNTITDFFSFDPAMIPYCKRDCEITKETFIVLNEIHNERHGKYIV